ncbi:MAG TPA: diphthamide biosynthesis enzyme Dph2 [Euryarchaeota archaeon]|nr:diphthamide biosynthesis enzyme Dph2 [Euryarchaeota archaeon]
MKKKKSWQKYSIGGTSLLVEEILNICRKENLRKVFIQVPEGLSQYAHRISSELIQHGITAIVSIDPCYGACDIPYWKAEILKCDAIIHVGHTKLGDVDVPIKTYYLPIKKEIFNIEALDVLSEILLQRGYKKIGLVTIAQFLDLLPKISEYINKKGFETYIGKPTRRVVEKGQILGCNVSSARNIVKHVDAYVYYGDGIFHPIVVYMATKKPVFVVNPYTGEVKDVSEDGERVIKARILSMAKAKEAKRFAIVISTKIGQYRKTLLDTVVDFLKKYNREYSIIQMENIDPEVINHIKGVDAFVVLACPRIVYDDYRRFKKPVLTASELIESLKGTYNWRFEEL